MSGRAIAAVLRDIEEFRPTNGNWRGLDDLLDELWALGVAEEHLPLLIRVFERYPEDDNGALWSLLHGIESLPFSYEELLRESMAHRPSSMAEIMLIRLESSRRRGD